MDIRAREIPPEGAVVVASRRHGTGAELDAFLSRYTVADKVSAGPSLKFCLLAPGRAQPYLRLGRTLQWDTDGGPAGLDGRSAGLGKGVYGRLHLVERRNIKKKKNK